MGSRILIVSITFVIYAILGNGTSLSNFGEKKFRSPIADPKTKDYRFHAMTEFLRCLEIERKDFRSCEEFFHSLVEDATTKNPTKEHISRFYPWGG